jgi:hypothetical protein
MASVRLPVRYRKPREEIRCALRERLRYCSRQATGIAGSISSSLIRVSVVRSIVNPKGYREDAEAVEKVASFMTRLEYAIRDTLRHGKLEDTDRGCARIKIYTSAPQQVLCKINLLAGSLRRRS